MKIHQIQYLLVCLVFMFVNTAWAVDDTTVQEIDTKATSANAKADGNNSRIQALEAEDIVLHERIDNIQLIPGEKGDKGDPGTDGAPGQDGSSCSVTQDPNGATIDCEDGSLASVLNGLDGAPGEQGADGAPGQDGTSCSVADNGDGTKTISCTDGSSVLVSDGAQGPPGEHGSLPDGLDPGDMLYWDGSAWRLTPAPVVDPADGHAILTLIDGVLPTWISGPVSGSTTSGGCIDKTPQAPDCGACSTNSCKIDATYPSADWVWLAVYTPPSDGELILSVGTSVVCNQAAAAGTEIEIRLSAQELFPPPTPTKEIDLATVTLTVPSGREEIYRLPWDTGVSPLLVQAITTAVGLANGVDYGFFLRVTAGASLIKGNCFFIEAPVSLSFKPAKTVNIAPRY